MHLSALLHFAIRSFMVFLVVTWGFAAAEEKNVPALFPEPQSFSVQIESNSSGKDLSLWQQTDKAMLLSPEKSLEDDPASGIDLRMSLDKLRFKSSIQQKKSGEDLLLTSSHMHAAPSQDLAAISTDAAASIGYQLDLLNRKLSVVPMMGLSYHGKEDQRILGSDASSEWNSWWVGLDLKANPKSDLSIETSFLFHNARFSEKGPDRGLGYESYKSEGEGKVFKLGIRQQFGNSWSAGILYSWQQWMADKGELPSSLMSDKGGNVPFGGDVQELNISLSYDF